jgi:hypothetical protein
MRLIGAFVEFARRVIDAARDGGLGDEDLLKLDNLLTRTGKRNAVLSKGILSALSAGGASDEDIERFGDLLERANQRILDDAEPFTESEQDEISDIFKRAYVSQKTARWFNNQLDELVAEEISEYISGRKRADISVVPQRENSEGETSESKRSKRRKARA